MKTYGTYFQNLTKDGKELAFENTVEAALWLINNNKVNLPSNFLYTAYFVTGCYAMCSVVGLSEEDILKVINDKYGHDAGDIAIKTIANSITKCFPGNSICMRTGGDEFSIIFYSDKSIDCQHYVNKLNSELDDFNKNSNLEFDVLISLGYYTENGKNIDDFEHVKKLADRALYKNKAERKALRI